MAYLTAALRASYDESHGTDVTAGMSFAMDLTPLIENADESITAYVQECCERFVQDVTDRLNRLQWSC